MTKKPKDNSVGPWAKEKLAALNAYLSAYTQVLKNQTWCKGTIYFDAFAGPGLSPVRTTSKSSKQGDGLFEGEDQNQDSEAIEFIKGSPRVALDIPHPFSRYIFNDKDEERLKELEQLKTEYQGRRNIDVKRRDANAELLALIASETNWRAKRGVVFIDPFGMQISWSTMQAIAKTKSLEVIINFPWAMAITRMITRSGEISPSWQAKLDDYFGSEEWRELVYTSKDDLFGKMKIKAVDSGPKILKWYRGRLKAEFGFVSTARLIKNTRGNDLYYLIWAGPHPKGYQIAEHILSKGQRI